MTIHSAFVLRSLKVGNFSITQHARQRMNLRNIRFNDIVYCANHLQKFSEQDNGNFKLDGLDMDGDELTVIAAYDGEVIVVNLF